ncbi:MAG TPA: hypothetical protein VFB20_15940 [Burkholderiales bacterium]|nr:hypothetical protein [Burkholderiales bacterium]
MSLLQVFRDEDLRIALDCLRRVELEDRACGAAPTGFPAGSSSAWGLRASSRASDEGSSTMFPPR